MSESSEYQAWNNFVLNSYPPAIETDRKCRAAAIANLYMGAANNGGINSFLTVTAELSTQEVLEAMRELGLSENATQFSAVVKGLGQELPASSSDARWNMLDQLWTDDLDDLDTLTTQSSAELMRILERHVTEYKAYYTSLGRL